MWNDKQEERKETTRRRDDMVVTTANGEYWKSPDNYRNEI